jgi:alpha-L-fucosidase
MVCAALALAAAAAQAAPKYEANWTSLDKRPIPAWFNEAKFGVFVCWGPYSVPAWVDQGYPEWYGWHMQYPDSPVAKFHLKNYGAQFKYEDFAPLLKAELWDPDFWADLFVKSGARYVVTTAKFHDGYCLWPCAGAENVRTKQWNSMVVGPHRDLLGELTAAGRKRGLKMGVYFSLYEWWHPLWLDPAKRERFVLEHMHPQFKELVTRYQPPIIILDGEWDMDYRKWHSEELAAWLYNESPVRDYVAVNDRWGQCRSQHGGYYSSEYGGGEYPPWHAWQEDRGIGHSYGFNRNESIYDYASATDLIRLLSKICGNGGNLILSMGPTPDGRLPVIMQERLLEIGRWLALNGEAIYGSRANPFWPRRFAWGTCTQKPGRLFLHVHDARQRAIDLRGLHNAVSKAYLLADRAQHPLPTSPLADGVHIDLPRTLPDPAVSVVALEIQGPPSVDKTTQQDDDGGVFLHCFAMKVRGTKAKVVFEGASRVLHVGEWSNPADKVCVDFVLRDPGPFEVLATYSSDQAAAGSRFAISIGDQRLAGVTENTGEWGKYKTVSLGRITLANKGRHTLCVSPAADGPWKGMGLQSVTLRPVKK